MNTPATRGVRRATLADVDALARLRHAFRAEAHRVVEDEREFLARCTEWMRARLHDGSHWRVWILDYDGDIVGNVWLQLVEKIPNPGRESEAHAYLSNFFVTPSARNTGGGSMLIAAALEHARSSHVDTVFLWPTPRSRALYERLGFHEANALLVNQL